MTYREQEPPYAVQVEMTEGCNLRCSFCGLNGIRGEEHDWKFMTSETAARIATSIREAGWNPRVEFAMHGEPTLNRSRNLIVGAFRAHLPNAQLMMTSNGGGLLGKEGPLSKISQLFASGLNVLALDDYEGVDIVPRIRKYLGDSVPETWEVYEYPKDPGGNPHQRWGPGARVVTFIADISKSSHGTHSVLNNHAGAGMPLSHAGMGKRCAKPFREMSFRWDGNVAVCCNDWRGIYHVGNVHSRSVAQLWNSPEMGAIRLRLYHGLRDVGPCYGCDATSYRVGLLPDKKGKETLPYPDEDDRAVALAACEGEPYTEAVLRPWEKEGHTNLVQLRGPNPIHR